jgi:xanthine dehydrogenase accessory factor
VIELQRALEAWRRAGKAFALATVIRTWGSSPRPVGAAMAISAELEMEGSVSGGCVEGAVVQVAQEVLRSGKPRRLHFGVSDERAWEVGLACGGQIEVWVEPWGSPERLDLLETLLGCLEARRPFLLARVLEEGEGQGAGTIWLLAEGMGPPKTSGADLPETLHSLLRKWLASRSSGVQTVQVAGGRMELFFHTVLPPPTLVIIGGVHIARALAAQAKTLGYRVVLVDPRRAFARRERFPQVDELLNEWPDKALATIGLTPDTAVAVLTHDPKVDDAALRVALPSPAFYVGALGSRKTQAARRERLAAAGVDPQSLARLRGPIGLPLGGRVPEEIALSILAEMVAVRAGDGLVGEAESRDRG